MKLEEIISEIVKDNTVAIVIINEEKDHYTSRTAARICEEQVVEILENIVKQWNNENAILFEDIRDQLPF